MRLSVEPSLREALLWGALHSWGSGKCSHSHLLLQDHQSFIPSELQQPRGQGQEKRLCFSG